MYFLRMNNFLCKTFADRKGSDNFAIVQEFQQFIAKLIV